MIVAKHGRSWQKARYDADKTNARSAESETAVKSPVPYVAEPGHVLEVSLLGSADLAYWRQQLTREALAPIQSEGRAQILVIAAEMTFNGIHFTEISFSILVTGELAGRPRETVFLVQSFGTSRLFVFFEKWMFRTPFQHGLCSLSVSAPVSIGLGQKSRALFRAEMGTDSPGTNREVLRDGEDAWEGPILLPGSGRPGSLFFGKANGRVREFAFVPGVDSLAIYPATDGGVFQALGESNFKPLRWRVRQNGNHGRSKTYPRSHEVVSRFYKAEA